MKTLLSITSIFFFLLVISCSDANDPFTITQNRVGHLTNTSKIIDIPQLFAKDSIVTNDSLGLANGTSTTRIWILENTGEQLISITPKLDTTHTVASVRILDSRYKTKKGIHLGSTVKDLKKAYTIKNITGTINSVAISVNESPAFFTIERKLLPGDLRFVYDAPIEETHLPDDAPITKLIVNW